MASRRKSKSVPLGYRRLRDARGQDASSSLLDVEGGLLFDSVAAKQRLANVTLHECARNGNKETLIRLLSDPSVRRHVDDLDDNGISALHYAAKTNNFEVVSLLLKQGQAKITVRDEEGATPLHYAARKKPVKNTEGALRVISLFTSKCPDVNMKDNYKSTPLHFAAMKGNTLGANALMSCRNILINAKDQHGCTPLHEAATYNQVGVAKLLIEHGANIRVRDNDQCTPLHLAVMWGLADMAELLLDKCEPNFVRQLVDAVDNEACTALHYAIESRCPPVVQLLVKLGSNINEPCRLRSSGSTPLHLAATSGDVETTRILVEHGARVEGADNRKNTALHKAAEYDCSEVADFLIREANAEVDARNQDNNTPLLTAVEYGSTDIVKTLLAEEALIRATELNDKNCLHLAAENDQDLVMKHILKHIQNTEHCQLVNGCDRHGDTPLHLAAERGNLTMVELLIKHGADTNLKNENEETAFLRACEAGRFDVVEALLERDDKCVNDEEEHSNTGLHLAAENGHLHVVQLLIESAAAKEARNSRSWTPLDIAAARGHVEVVSHLLAEDVSPNPMDKNQTTPLHLAAKNGHSIVVQVLLDRGADVAAVDVEGKNCLDIAIEHGHGAVVATVLESKFWYVAMANENSVEHAKPRDTPLRKLIRRMPDVANLALSRCITFGPEGAPPSSRERYILFNYDYMDDTYTDYRRLRREPKPAKLEDQCTPDAGRAPYCKRKNWIKENHPLSHLISGTKGEYKQLIGHPLVLGLIRHKWSITKMFYFLFLGYYAAFVSMVTAYMIVANAPYLVPVVNGTSIKECVVDQQWLQSEFEGVAKFVVWGLAPIGMAIEMVQMSSQGVLYLKLNTALDWFAYVTAIIIVVDYDSCGLRTDWQWQLGAFTVLVAWLNLLLFLRRLPGLGIYVVMITVILSTFTRFFVVFFLFIVAFAVSFFILLENQDPFSEPWYAVVKSWVMMLQEFDFNDMFFNQSDDQYIPYELATYTMFICFLVIMSIIVMNLLVGLAVDDVSALRRQAKIVKLRLQVELALDIELAMPESWRFRMRSNVRREKLYLNRDERALWRLVSDVQKAIEGPLLSLDAVVEAAKEVDTGGGRPEMMALEQRLRQDISGNRNQLQQLGQKMDRIEGLLETLVRGGRPPTPRRRTPRVSLSRHDGWADDVLGDSNSEGGDDP